MIFLEGSQKFITCFVFSRIDIKDRKKLRKLRLTENDAEIDGTELSDRLKAQ